MRRLILIMLFAAGIAALAVAQARAEQRRARPAADAAQASTERVARRATLAPNGRVSIANISGNIVVTAGSGSEVVIDAVKRTRDNPSSLATVRINVNESAGRIDIDTEHTARNDRVSVDYTVTVPSSASLEEESVSGNISVTGVQGSSVRAETVSGNVTMTATPRVDAARTVSGTVELSDINTDGTLNASSVSGDVRARGLTARGLDVGTVSGAVSVSDAACDRVNAHSVSGGIEWSGALARNGRYHFESHSGSVRLRLADTGGFDLTATSFSGSIDTSLPLAGMLTERRRIGPPNRSIRGTFGDGSAQLTIETFSGSIFIARR